MTSRLNPYLMFNGNAREALEFYHSVLGGKLDLAPFGMFGNDDPAIADKIMHGNLHSDADYTIMASDAPPGETADASSSNVTVSISGDKEDADKLRGYFEKLAEGGTVTLPLERQMWGDDYGQLTDRYGVKWMVNIAGS